MKNIYTLCLGIIQGKLHHWSFLRSILHVRGKACGPASQPGVFRDVPKKRLPKVVNFYVATT